MAVMAMSLGIWWMWWLRQPRHTGYRARDKARRRVCM